MNVIIKANQLSKIFGSHTALNQVSFKVNQGDCLAIIGPNGAGKSVLLSSLIGERVPSSGQLDIFGKSPTDKTLTTKIGMLFQENLAEEKLTVDDVLTFQKNIYPNPLSDNEINQMLGFSINERKKLISQLSGGQRRLLAFVRVLIGQPELLILDEPTAAMDTSTRHRFWKIIDELKHAGKTIIYSSHYIEEVEHTADRILVLHRGKLLRDTTPYQMRLEDKDKYFTVPVMFREILNEEMMFDLVEKHDVISFATKHPKQILEQLLTEGCSIEEIEMTNRTLLNSIFNDENKEITHENI